jgi:hypothetical protein
VRDEPVERLEGIAGHPIDPSTANSTEDGKRTTHTT